MNTRRLHRCFRLAALALLWLVAAGSARGAEMDAALSIVLGHGPYYAPNRWLPIKALFTNRTGSPINGVLVCPIKTEQGTVTFRLPVTAPARAKFTAVAYIYIPVLPEAPANKKGGPLPPLFIAEWRNDQGGMIDRSEVLGRPAGEEELPDSAGALPVNRPLVLAISEDVSDPSLESVSDVTSFAAMLQGPMGTRVYGTSINAHEAPRQQVGYDMASIVLLSGVRPENFDAAQRQALIDFMRSGGTVVLAPPHEGTDPAGTWLAPFLPAVSVGTRYAESISIGETVIKPVAPLDLCEWIAHEAPAVGSHVVAGDEHYVHLAYQSVGLGRLAITSFPITGLDVKDPAVRDLWRAALVPAQSGVSWENSELARGEREILQSMVGLKVPAWTAAAAIVGAYVLLVLAIQLFARQSLRPTGFAAAIALSVLLAGGLLVIALFKDKSVDLSMARLSVLDLGAGGVRHEAISLLGPEETNMTLSASRGASLRQAPEDSGGLVDLALSPPGGRASIKPRQLDQIWQATAAVPAEHTLRATGRFDANGLAINIDNTVGTLTAPLLIAGDRHFSLADIPQDETSARADDANLNPPGPPINSATVQLAAQQLRGKILEASLKPADPRQTGETAIESPLTLAGWLETAPPLLVTLPGGVMPIVTRDNTLVRTRVQLLPSPLGSSVHIDGAFTRMIPGIGGSQPFDGSQRQWLPQFTPSDFQVGFAVPPGIGKLQTRRVTIHAQFNAPQHQVVVRRGQCPGGKVQFNPAGPDVATWDKPIGRQTIAFDVQSGDVDANGWIWLVFQVQKDDFAPAQWVVNDLSAGYDGTIQGPPQAPVLPTRDFSAISRRF